MSWVDYVLENFECYFWRRQLASAIACIITGVISFFVIAFDPSSLSVFDVFADFSVMLCLAFRCDMIGEDFQCIVLFSLS